MRQKSLIDVYVVSEDPYFINRIKIFSQNSKITFEYMNNSYYKSATSLFLIDANRLDPFLKENPNLNTVKFVVHGDQKDLAAAFNAGCTDFLKNPWNYDELEARILKILNLKNIHTMWDKLTLSQKTISTDSYSTNISIEEYIILKKLIENRNEPVPREVLLYTLWGKQKEESRVVDMHISNLRKKIEILKKFDKLCCGGIKTIRSYGYMII
ncbi:MAG: response regulator transcription factor [Spirochaetales bacterium]|nr:response regulator transcription factor [Spirochaetales bacterium]